LGEEKLGLKTKNMAAEKIITNEKVSTDKEKALELAINQIEKRFGKGSVMKLGANTMTPIDVVPSGSLALDIALGVGGIPKGRITEIYGPEASGKTTLAQHIIAEAQKQGMVAAYIDVEHALDRSYASDCGVKTEDLYISQPDTGEQALEICEALVRSGAVDVIVVDSVAALVPQAEIEGEMGESHVGLQARLMSQALRKLAAAISKSNAVVIFINQLREKVGIVYGNPEVTPGGRALKFYSSVRIDLRRTETIMQGNEAVGNHVKAKIVKNKVAPPFRSAEFDIMFSHGISKEGDLVDLGVQQGLINKSGAFFSYGDVRLGQGRENAKTYLSQHPEVAKEIEQKIRASADTAKSPPAAESAE
jgi:recombination protein RecA